MTYARNLLGEHLTFSNGRSSPERSEKGEFTVFGSNGPIGRANESNSPEGTIVIGRVGSYCGSLYYSAEKSWVTDNAIKAIAKQPKDSKYWFYLLSTQNLNDLSSGSGQPLINQTALKAVEVPTAPPEDRCLIGQVLSSLDDKIELNRRMNETLEALAQAIFKDWFVDFGPTRRKATGETNPVAILGNLIPNPAKAQKTAALFPNSFGDDRLPEGWTRQPLADDFNLTMGQSPPGDTYNTVAEGLPFFQGRTDFGFRFPDNRIFCASPTRTGNTDDTLVSVRAPVGDVNIAWEKCCIGRGVAAVRHKSGAKSFTFHTMLALRSELQLFEHNGTVFGAINKKQFETLPSIGMPPELVREFEELVGPMDDRVRVSVGENRTLAETRDYLLPKLMSGEVRARS